MSETKEILTPDYWENEEFQPLVESQTVYGHKVSIPKIWLGGWEMLRCGRSQQDLVESLKRPIERRGRSAADFARVLLEIYQPEPIDPQTPPDEN